VQERSSLAPKHHAKNAPHPNPVPKTSLATLHYSKIPNPANTTSANPLPDPLFNPPAAAALADCVVAGALVVEPEVAEAPEPDAVVVVDAAASLPVASVVLVTVLNPLVRLALANVVERTMLVALPLCVEFPPIVPVVELTLNSSSPQ
jgi:hypothetical protein